ncbi:class I adenylate-forming enzyme family protein [Halomarina litorea]|uniref:class I adenylate-forming enzyme family protein n=1 Tax=Halomarina litorea TaxID=2961595 RepID=UPI0020C2A0BE|nr:AMP-binding protein [Halomarina sp. BCD28]
MVYPTVRDLLAQTAARSPDATALRDPAADRTLTYAEWDGLVTRVANGLLDAGLSPGDHLSVMTKDSVEQLTLLFAAAELGVLFNPISYRAPAGRLSYVLDHAEADAFVFDEAALDTVREVESATLPALLVGRNASFQESEPYGTLTGGSTESPHIHVTADDAALLLYTSGTTGTPKGVRHTHRNVVLSDLACLPYNRLRPSDTNLALGPLYHVGPLLANFMPALHVGATNVIQRDFDPATTLDYVESEGVTAMWGVPTHFNDLVSEPDVADRDVSDVRMIQYSGAAMPREVVRECREHFPDVDFVNAYGTTEIVFGTVIHPEDHDERLGSIGRAVPNAEVRLVDPDDPRPGARVLEGATGEILVKTPTCMEGYWKDPERTEEAVIDGWYRTGDLARRDEDGFLYFVDRKDSMIVSGGENVYPTEVEDVLYRHEGVESVAVVGVPHRKWGEVVTAFVVPTSAASGDSSDEESESDGVRTDPDVTEADLDEHFRAAEDVEAFKRPREYVFRDSLPKTESGKISRSALKAEVAG